GVRSIEQGNLIDADAARAIREAGAYIVPTMATYEVIARDGARYGIGTHQLRKIQQARDRSVEGLTHAYRAGCKIASGSDLLGDMAVYRPLELELKGQVLTPMEGLESATRVDAELLRLDHRIGTLEPGKDADLIAVTGNPLEDLRLFQDPERLHLVMKGGAVYCQRV